MKKRYFHHFRNSDDYIKSVWADATFALDANILLNFYRYSEASREEFFGVLEKLKDRIWISEQAAHEFFKNRISVISDQADSYAKAQESIQKLKDDLSKSHSHPFIAADKLEKLNSILDEVNENLGSNQDAHFQRVYGDDIMDRLADLFEDRIGAEYSEEDLDKIMTEGETRFAEGVPPGYKDAKKAKDPQSIKERRSVYGDLILWQQTIDFSKESKRSVIFVTDDAKEDWWLKHAGKTVGPRTELIEEFREGTGKEFLMYSFQQFLKFANEHLAASVSVSSDAIKEASDAERARARATVKEMTDNMILNITRRRKDNPYDASGAYQEYLERAIMNNPEYPSIKIADEMIRGNLERARVSKQKKQAYNQIAKLRSTQNQLADEIISLQNIDAPEREIRELHEKYDDLETQIMFLKDEITRFDRIIRGEQDED